MNAIQTAVSDGTLVNINVGIEYFSQSDISVYLDTSVNPLVVGVDYSWTSPTVIHFLAGPVPNGVVVTLSRATEVDAMYNIYDGGAPWSRLTLDENFKQLLFLAQEFTEGTNTTAFKFALRAPDTALNTLPSAVQRANRLLSFGPDGQPVMVLPSADSAAGLRSDLMELSDLTKGVSLVGRSVVACDTIADMKLLPRRTDQIVLVRAYYGGWAAATPYRGPRGGGMFTWDATSVLPDNGGTVFQATGVATGRWLRVFDDDTEYQTAWFGAKGDFVQDDQPFIQACINAAMLALHPVFINTGNYRLNTGISIDNSASTTYLDPKKIWLRGAGTSQTQLTYFGTGQAFSIIGGTTAATLPMQCFQEFHGFSLEGQNTVGTVGLNLDTAQQVTLRNIEVRSFDLALNLLDVDFGDYQKLVLHWCSRGVLGLERAPRQINSTRTNGMNFTACHIGGMTQYGGYFKGAACVNFYGGDIEGCGIGGTGNRWGLMFEDGGVQGGVTCNLNGVYFEQNEGVADVWISAVNAPGVGLNPPHANHVIQNCSFNRPTSANFTTNNIRCDFVSALAGKQKLILTGNSFKGYGTYVPNAGRKYVAFGNDVMATGSNYLAWGNLFQDAVEAVPQTENFFCSVGLSGPQTIATSSATDILWTSELDDADNMHATSTAIITIPVTGRYHIVAQVGWAGNSVGSRQALVFVGANEVAGAAGANAATFVVRQGISRILNLNANDQIKLQVLHDSGGNLNVGATTTFMQVRSV